MNFNFIAANLQVDVVEQRNYEKRMAELAKKEMNEQRKLEKELQRQRILEEHRRKKEENEKGNTPEVASARTPGRHQSQPPFSRTQSQVNFIRRFVLFVPFQMAALFIFQLQRACHYSAISKAEYARTLSISNLSFFTNALAVSKFNF